MGNVEFDRVIGPRPAVSVIRGGSYPHQPEGAASRADDLADSRPGTRSGSHAAVRTGLRAGLRDGARFAAREGDGESYRVDDRERRRRKRASARADRMYERQYASDLPASEAGEGTPRAALYEGQVGPSQRRAARMQKASEAGPVSAKVNPAGWFSGLSVSKRALRGVTAALCLVLTCAFLYTPAQQYYQAMREHDRLEAEYAYIEQRNDAIDAQNVALASNAGMEDAVRQKYGYVVQGDETAVVTGLSDSAGESRKSDHVEANVLSSAVKAPEEWYTPYLDAFFGVS